MKKPQDEIMSHRELILSNRKVRVSDRKYVPLQCVWRIPRVYDEELGIEGEYACEHCVVRLRKQTGKKLGLKANAFDDLCDFCYPDGIDIEERKQWLRERRLRKEAEERAKEGQEDEG